VFDALSIRRPYKEAWPVDKIVAYVDGRSGTDFDPALVDVFHRTLPKLLDIQQTWDARDSELQPRQG
jgi:putative two-component system response regulator